MLKNALVTAITTATLLLILTACGGDDQSNPAEATAKKPAAGKQTNTKAQRPKRPQAKATEPQPMDAFQSSPIMNKPVDFSSPESIKNSIQAIQEEAGDKASNRVESAISYMLVYDLSVGRNKQKLYKKLDGKTPNQILAMTGR